jgi:hypothetical protein
MHANVPRSATLLTTRITFTSTQLDDTALMRAADWGHVEAVEVLSGPTSDINYANRVRVCVRQVRCCCSGGLLGTSPSYR